MTSTVDLAPGSVRSGGLKHLFVRGLLTALSGTAALGIYAVLTASFDVTGVRILTSTLLVGLYCMFCLAGVGVLDTRHRWVGAAGISAASTALAQGLFLIWSLGDDLPGDTAFLLARGFLLTAIVAFALAHAALLLRLDLSPAGGGATLRRATLAAVGVVATLLAAPLLQPELAESFGYWRLVGVVAILDVLGTVALPVLARADVRSAR